MIYELRTYVCTPGRLKDVVARFKAPVIGIWKEIGIEAVGFWTNEADGQNELVYLLSWNSQDERDEKMSTFAKDPRWLEAKEISERDGAIVESFSSKTLAPTEFSALR